MNKVNLVILGLLLLTLPLLYNNCSQQEESPVVLASGREAVLPGCVPGEGASGSPATMEGVVDLINSLPKPVTIPCFLQSLDRPLKINATASEFSAQPAFSRSSPRIFIFIDRLILSVVPEGDSGDLLEYSFLINNNRSIKAELKFPVAAKLAYSAPFERIIDPESVSNNTFCLPCHGSEVRVPEIDYATAYSSTAFKPAGNRVFVRELESEHLKCESNGDGSSRCLFLKVLFSEDVSDQDFPDAMNTI